VLGAAGGVRFASIEVVKSMGGPVIVAASSDEKLELCHKTGADMLINYKKKDLLKSTLELAQDKGVVVVFDPMVCRR